jgi:PAS domain-containing protein
MSRDHYFICPHCGNRMVGVDRRGGFGRDDRACEKCGFAYVFELLDDYYPAPNAAFFATDRQGRVIDCGRGSFEMTGLKTERVIGRPISDVLGLEFEDGNDAVATALEWEVRVKGKPVHVHAEGDLPLDAVADIFPAYDDPEGGLLVVLTPAARR